MKKSGKVFGSYSAGGDQHDEGRDDKCNNKKCSLEISLQVVKDSILTNDHTDLFKKDRDDVDPEHEIIARCVIPSAESSTKSLWSRLFCNNTICSKCVDDSDRKDDIRPLQFPNPIVDRTGNQTVHTAIGLVRDRSIQGKILNGVVSTPDISPQFPPAIGNPASISTSLDESVQTEPPVVPAGMKSFSSDTMDLQSPVEVVL
jgi:hypothetical protein